MKVIYCLSSLDKNDGGTSVFIKLFTNELIKTISIALSTLKTNEPLVLDERIEINWAQNSFPWISGYSEDFQAYFNNAEVDIFHGNGLWQYPVHSMVYFAIKRNIPFVFSPHGMLEPWALNVSKLKKKVALELFQRKDLEAASCIHATAKSEAETIRKLGFTNPIAVIPNGIDLSEFPISIKERKKGKRTLLFLSRIHPKKGIEFLIDAWFRLDSNFRQDWQIEIAGNGDPKYVKTLRQIIFKKGLANEIKIIGPRFGNEKLKTYHKADLFVLPTYSENFGLVVAEALACGIPVITTIGTPWEELNIKNAGWWVDIGVEPLVQSLKEAMELTDSERQIMGENGRKLIEENYSIEIVTKQMIKLYDWILGKKEKPSFVFLD